MEKINNFLDKYVLPWPVRFLTHRFVILLTISLLAPLIAFASNTVFVLTANSYLNTMSVAVSSIVLLYATIAEIRDKQIAEMQEKRAQEDHIHVVEMHQLVIANMRYQHDEIQDLKKILSEIKGLKFERQPVPENLSSDLKELHPRGKARFEESDVRNRMNRRVIRHRLGERLAEGVDGFPVDGSAG